MCSPFIVCYSIEIENNENSINILSNLSYSEFQPILAITPAAVVLDLNVFCYTQGFHTWYISCSGS